MVKADQFNGSRRCPKEGELFMPLMPPGWAHYVVNADTNSQLIFGACCDRQYGFDYTQMRAHHGLAWLPVFSDGGEIAWDANPNYLASTLGRRKARNYPELGLSTTLPIHESFRLHSESVQWASDPERFTALWRDFQP